MVVQQYMQLGNALLCKIRKVFGHTLSAIKKKVSFNNFHDI